jgi:hypothetical protein
VHEDFIARVLADAFFGLPCPKSLDRNAFAFTNLDPPDFSTADDAATLSVLTAVSVKRIVPHLPAPPKSWIVAGGGAQSDINKNAGRALAPASVERADTVGWSSQSIEAQAFAHLAVGAKNGLPITFPTTTGLPKPMPAASSQCPSTSSRRLFQKRRTERGFEGPIVVGDLVAFADVAAGENVAIFVISIGIFRMVHEGIVVYG